MTIFERVEELEKLTKEQSQKIAKLQENESSIVDRLNVAYGAISSIEETLESVLNATDDSGWVQIPLTNGAVAYSDATAPQCRRIGNVVAIRGAVKGITERNTTIGRLPEGFRPTMINPYVQNTSMLTGNVAATSRMTISAAGNIQIQGVTKDAVFEADKWFPLATMFFIK